MKRLLKILFFYGIFCFLLLTTKSYAFKLDYNTTDNISSAVSSSTLPDLTISATISTNYLSGQTGVQIPVTVHRSGGSLTQGTYVLARVFWSTNSTWDSGDTQLWESNGSIPDYPIGYLNSYGSKTVTATINIPSTSSGTYYIIAYVDPLTESYPSGFHTESNENNNIAVYTVSITTLPDLTVSATIVSSYSSGQTGVQVPVTVNRSGGNLTQGTWVLTRLYWSTNSSWDYGDLQLWESNGSIPDYPIGYLNSYGSKTVTATINIPSTSSGTYYIIAYVDPLTESYPSGFHTESNENNNIAVYTVSITTFPDLTVSATIASSYSSGQTGVQVPVTVNRSGGSLTQGTYVLARVFWSTNSTWDSGDTQLWESNGSIPDYPIDYLNNYGSKTVTATINIPSTSSGTYYIIAYVDPLTESYPSGFHAESNENNNVSIYTVNLTNSSLVLLDPVDNETITNNEIKFRWSNVNAIRYELIVDNNSSFNSPEISKQHIAELGNYTNTEYTICGNWLPQNVFYCKVKAIFPGGNYTESAVSKFIYTPPTAARPNWQPLYRLYNSNDYDHFYCASESHGLIAIGSGYKYERTEGYVSIQRFNASDLVNIFRFYDNKKKCHYYTTDETDKDIQIMNQLTYEGIAGFAYANSHPGLAPLYHLKKEFSTTNHDHFYTISEIEKVNAQSIYGFVHSNTPAYVSLAGGQSTVPVYFGQLQVGNGINSQNGNFRNYTKTSFNISSIGLPLVFEHIYNSLNVQLPAQITPIGPGWSHSYNACIVSYQDSLEVIWPDGSIHHYHSSTLVCGTRGVYDELTKIATGHYQIKKKDQTVYIFKRPSGTDTSYPAMLYSINDRNGNTITLTYETTSENKRRRLKTITCPDGRSLSITYHDESNTTAHLIKRINDPINRSIYFEYDSNDNLWKFTDAEGQVTQYYYDTTYPQDHMLVNIKLPKGNIIDNSYKDRKIVSQKLSNSTQQLSLSYSGNKTTITDEMNRTFDIKKYSSGFPQEIKCTSMNTGSIYFTRSDANRPDLPTQIKDQNGYTTNYSYDKKGNVLKIQQPLGINHYYEYDNMNNLIKYTDPRGKVTTYTYDAKGNLVSIHDPLSHRISFSPLSNGLISSISNQMNHTTYLGYDNYGNLTSVRDPLSNSTTYIYDGASRITQMTNAKNQVTRLSYTVNDWIKTVTNAAGGITRYEYDANDNLISITDPKGQVTNLEYHFDRDLLTAISNPLGNRVRYTYYNDGSMSNKTLPSGTSIGYTYDQAGRLNMINYPSATVMFSYDNNSNITGVSDNNGSMSFSYDAVNRLTSYKDFFDNVVKYGYDEAGNLISITYPGSKTVTYHYYDDNRLRSVTDWNSHSTTYTYRADGALQDISFPNGCRCSYSYDSADRLRSISNTKSGGDVIASYNYELDEIGNHTSVTYNEPYNVPNIIAQNITLSYNSANRLQKAGSTSYSYGANGTLVSTSGTHSYNYTWDSEKRLIGVSGAQTASYVYDAFGNRRQATRNGNKVRFVLDIQGSMSQVLMEKDAAGNVLNYYIYGIGLIARIKGNGSTTHYYHYNNIGSTIAITDAGGNISHQYAYDPFGKVTNSQEADANPFRFVGRFGLMDEGNGLYFMRARYYEAETGRFISEDPVWATNLFTYAYSNPAIFIDPTGFTSQNESSFWKNLWSSISDFFLDIGTSKMPAASGIPLGETAQLAEASVELAPDLRKLNIQNAIMKLYNDGRREHSNFLQDAYDAKDTKKVNDLLRLYKSQGWIESAFIELNSWEAWKKGFRDFQKVADDLKQK